MKHITILLAALVLVLGTHALTRADAPAGVTKWEYKLAIAHSQPTRATPEQLAQERENLAQKGTPSRAEVTDAAMSGRAECVGSERI